MRYALVLAVVVSVSLSVICFRQHQKLEAYRELSRVSDELIAIQEVNYQKLEKLFSYCSPN